MPDNLSTFAGFCGSCENGDGKCSMRVGIVTFHCSYNFGSALQAFALQRTVEKLGHRAFIIDYRGRDFRQYRLFRLSRSHSMARMLLNLGRNIERKNSFERFWESQFNLTATYTEKDEGRLGELTGEFDCFVCGSDQIWNLDCTNGPVGPYFLNFAGERRRVAYAPSLAHESFRPENFPEDAVREYLEKFDAISVREEGTVDVYQPLCPLKIEVALDPTLLLDPCEWDSVLPDEPVEREPYVFFYMLERSPALLESARALASSTGVRVVYVAERDLKIDGAVNRYGCGPSEFLDLVKGSQAVLTNSFHATVFSILYGVPFHAFATEKSSARMRDLLGKLGLLSFFKESEDGSLPSHEGAPDVAAKLAEMRKSSLAFLAKGIEG